MNKTNANSTFFVIIATALIILFLCKMGMPQKSCMSCGQSKKSYMTGEEKPQVISGTDMDLLDEQYASVDLSDTHIDLDLGCAMNAGTGLSSSLLPRELASKEDFGQFAPDEILKGQNFLSAREMVGYPETFGGSLRNANQQIRAEPPNPKKVYAFNNSTIVPDLMQRKLC